MSAASDRAFRLATQVITVVLAVQCVWLLLTELSLPGIDRLPTDAQAAAAATTHRNDAIWTAWMGAIRGDLWADAAFTRADLLWASRDGSSAQNSALEKTRTELDRALGRAPHISDAWLLLAGLDARFQVPQVNSSEILKMAYYTGASERTVIPLRLRIAAQLDRLDDIELQQFVGRDLRLLFAAQHEAAIAEAYADATPAGRHLIEQAVGELNPAYLTTLHAAGAPQ